MKKNIKIKNITLDNPIFLAPMAGVTDHPFRVICREMGAGVVYTEFVSSDGIIRESVKTLDMIKFKESERPIAVQIFGSCPEVVSDAAKIVCEKFSPDILDINYGCPVPKVVNRGAGSGALKDLCLMDDITSAVIEKTPSSIPITVKMRIGFDSSHIVSTEAATRLEKLGVSAIALHPRTTRQAFTGKADWTYIKEMKNSVSIPIIGNGDIKNADDALRMFEETGCDAIMIARGCLGNPWLFKQIQNKLRGLPQDNITVKDRINICKYHLKLLRKNKNPQLALNLTKKHFSWYLKGFNNAVTWRTKFLRSKNHEEIDNVMIDFEEFLNSD